MTAPDLIQRLRDEAGLCRNETAEDVANLLEEAANALTARDAVLRECQEYIEECEVKIDGEWGSCRNLKQLIADDEMPELYAKVLEALK